MRTYPNEALEINDILKYSHKLFDTFEKLEFRTTFNIDDIVWWKEIVPPKDGERK